MKAINKKLVKVKSALSNVMEERDVLTMLNSPFVTNLKYALQDENTLYLVYVAIFGSSCAHVCALSITSILPFLFAAYLVVFLLCSNTVWT